MQRDVVWEDVQGDWVSQLQANTWKKSEEEERLKLYSPLASHSRQIQKDAEPVGDGIDSIITIAEKLERFDQAQVVKYGQNFQKTHLNIQSDRS